MKEWYPRRSTVNRITNNNKIVRFIFEEMDRQHIHEKDMSERIGFHRDTLRKWRTEHQPSIIGVQDCLDYLGYKLTIQRKSKSEEE